MTESRPCSAWRSGGAARDPGADPQRRAAGARHRDHRGVRQPVGGLGRYLIDGLTVRDYSRMLASSRAWQCSRWPPTQFSLSPNAW
ncbi:hypothetical protein QJS66_14760 [Kocuria rhizophila]|nr:hypothetical protein QJS66_14760 [Kocuria rhizophila]